MNLIKKKFWELGSVPNAEIAVDFCTKEEIWERIKRICFAINEDAQHLRSIAESMHSRFQAVIDADGNHTRY